MTKVLAASYPRMLSAFGRFLPNASTRLSWRFGRVARGGSIRSSTCLALALGGGPAASFARRLIVWPPQPAANPNG